MNVFGANGILKSINNYPKPDRNNFDFLSSGIPYKGMPRPTDGEFVIIINDLAKEIAEARYSGNESKLQALSEKESRLRSQYISIVSPDRKALADEAMQFMRGVGNEIKKKHDGPKALIDYIIASDERIAQRKSDGSFHIALKSGTMVFSGELALSDGDFSIESHDGQELLHYSHKSGWSYSTTPQENAMMKKYYEFLNASVSSYLGQIKDAANIRSDSADSAVSDGNKLNIKA